MTVEILSSSPTNPVLIPILFGRVSLLPYFVSVDVRIQATFLRVGPQCAVESDMVSNGWRPPVCMTPLGSCHGPGFSSAVIPSSSSEAT